MDRTPWNPEWSAAIERVTVLVENLFSCRVKFQTLETFLDRSQNGDVLHPEFQKQDLVFLESTLFEPPTLIRGRNAGSFAFPLRVRRAGAAQSDVSLVGIATIEGLAAYDDERLQILGEFLHMSVEARLNAFERLLDVEQKERSAVAVTAVNDNSKVIRLVPRRAAEASPPPDSYMLQNFSDELLLNNPIMIVARGENATLSRTRPHSRIALELFNRTSLWFFVNISDLSDEAFSNAQAFRDLGRMCIFIPDLAAVSIERQLRLAEVFGEPLENDSPRVICVAHDDPSELVENGVLLPHLLSLLSAYELAPNVVNAGDFSGNSLQKIVSDMKMKLGISSVANRDSETKASNLVHLLGRWRQDDGSNPTFH